MKVQAMFWDHDGVLGDLNISYYNFVTNHPNYKELYKDLKFKDLPKVLPILPKYGALELKTHPTLGEQMDHDFCHSPEFFNNRPLYPGAIKVLKELDKRGIKQITASATFDVPTKTKLLKSLYTDAPFLNIECVQHGTFMHDTAKKDLLAYCCEKYNVDPKNCILIDDRIYNLPAALELGMIAIRMRSRFTTDAPAEYAHVPEVTNLKQIPEMVKLLEMAR